MLELDAPALEPTVEQLVDDDQKSSAILDLSKKGLKKVPKTNDAQHVKELILDENLLHKIDNIDSFLKIEKVCIEGHIYRVFQLIELNIKFLIIFHFEMKISVCKNNLLRMYGLSRLHMLQEVNLSNNGIVTIEGVKELVQLRHLNLHGNNIKTIEHLNANVHLEHLNLSENSIGSISDISMLKNLKVRLS